MAVCKATENMLGQLNQESCMKMGMTVIQRNTWNALTQYKDFVINNSGKYNKLCIQFSSKLVRLNDWIWHKPWSAFLSWKFALLSLSLN